MDSSSNARVHPALWIGLAGALGLLLWRGNRARAGRSLAFVGGKIMSLRAILEKHEGNVPYAYRDQAGLWTIGVGHLIRANEQHLLSYTKDRPAPPELIEALLKADTAAARAAVERVERRMPVALTENQRAALTSLAFNIGAGAFESSGVAKALMAGDPASAARAMLAWNKITQDGAKVVSVGLAKRRDAERALFLTA